MALTDDARRRLFSKLVNALGEAEAVSLMDELPPPGEGAVSKAHVDRHFDTVDLRFAAVDQRFDVVDQRFDALEHRFDAVERRLDGLEQRVDALEQRLDAVEQRLIDRLERRIAEHRGEMHTLLSKHTRVTVLATVTMNAATIGAVFTAVGLS